SGGHPPTPGPGRRPAGPLPPRRPRRGHHPRCRPGDGRAGARPVRRALRLPLDHPAGAGHHPPVRHPLLRGRRAARPGGLPRRRRDGRVTVDDAVRGPRPRGRRRDPAPDPHHRQSGDPGPVLLPRRARGVPMPDMTPGVASALSPLVRRIVAPNPGRMTLTGTNTYLVGIDEVAVIDPGPDDAGHIEAIVGASMRERVRWILVTHHHIDHSAGVNRLKRETGAEIVAFGPPKSVQADWAPDRKAKDGEVIEGTEWGLEVLHTPGHASDHLCFFLEEERVLFTGDTVLSGT